MRVITPNTLRSFGNVIPNLDASIYKFTKIDAEYQLVHTPTDIVLAKYASGWPSSVYFNFQALKDLGFEFDRAIDNTNLFWNLIDDIFYQYNPIKFLKSNGQPYYGVIKKLACRCADQQIYSKTTTNLLESLSLYVKDKVRLLHPDLVEGSTDYAKAWNKALPVEIHRYLGKCVLTGIQVSKYEAKEVLISSTTKLSIIKAGVDPVNYGYTPHTFTETPSQRNGYRRNRTVWLKSNERVVENIVIDVNTVTLRSCSCCGRALPEQLFGGGSTTCITCESSTHTIHGYSTKAEQLLSFKAKKVTKDTIYLGCELEFETSDREVARVKVGKRLRGHAIMKSDGSIRNGFEVVTCPATIDIQLEVFKSFFTDPITELRNASNVGMHVHVSRKPLSVLTVGKLTRFMNHPDNKAFIELLAGRANNTYCRQDRGRAEHLSYPLLYPTGGDRYNVLNLNNQNTIEFRIFSTPLSYEDFASKLQFIQALVDYSKPCAVNLSAYAHAKFEEFIKWVKQNTKSYPELAIKLKGL